jgi:hypothetical protein
MRVLASKRFSPAARAILPGVSTPARRRWHLHGLSIEGSWPAPEIGERWCATFAPLPLTDTAPDLSFELSLAEHVPAAPSAPADFKQGELLAYYLHGPQVLAHFPRYGQLQLDLAHGATTGVITSAALANYGVFEDLLAIGLSPHLRRRSQFLLHAFAAAPEPNAPAVLIVGDIGAGKTTTGLALLHAGWKLLSNDSPILTTRGGDVTLLAYPGLLSAYPDTLGRFPELGRLIPPGAGREKTIFAAEAVYPDVWLETAAAGALVFPRIEARAGHALEPLATPEALRLILPHAIEQWDRDMIPGHLALLRQLIQTTPAYRLRLGPDTNTLPALLANSLLKLPS